MSHDTSVALELARRPGRPTTAHAPATRDLWTRWTCMRVEQRRAVADWEEPRARFDRLHAEFRHPLGRF